MWAECGTDSTEKMVSCLRSQPANRLVDPSGTGHMDPNFLMSWGPGLEEGHFADVPDALIKSSRFNKDVALMVGFTQVEGFMMGRNFVLGFDQPGFDLPKFKFVSCDIYLLWASVLRIRSPFMKALVSVNARCLESVTVIHAAGIRCALVKPIYINIMFKEAKFCDGVTKSNYWVYFTFTINPCSKQQTIIFCVQCVCINTNADLHCFSQGKL